MNFAARPEFPWSQITQCGIDGSRNRRLSGIPFPHRKAPYCATPPPQTTIYMKKAWLGIVFLLVAAGALAGCASSPPGRTFVAGDASARPPETGTYIPRRIREESSQAAPKRPAKRKPTRPKAKPTPKPGPREEVLTRGGFR